MLRLTRTAIGLLTAQYRSVLRKCWAINVGVFSLMGKAVASVSNGAADTIGGTLNGYGINVIAYMLGLLDSLLNIKSNAFGEQSAKAPATKLPFGAPTVAGTLSAFGVNVMDGILLNLQSKKFVTLKALPAADLAATIAATVPSQAEAMTADEMLAILRNTTTSSEISWSSASKVTDPTVKPAAPTISGGVVRFDIEGIPYDFAYTYTKPQSWAEITDEPTTNTVDVNSNWDVYTGGRIREYTDSISNSVFVNNKVSVTFNNTTSVEHYKEASGTVYTNGTITSFIADFINNGVNVSATSTGGGAMYVYAYGGALFNSGTITTLDGVYNGNYANGTWAYGGAAFNGGTIEAISGTYNGNYANGSTYGWGGL